MKVNGQLAGVKVTSLCENTRDLARSQSGVGTVFSRSSIILRISVVCSGVWMGMKYSDRRTLVQTRPGKGDMGRRRLYMYTVVWFEF